MSRRSAAGVPDGFESFTRRDTVSRRTACLARQHAPKDWEHRRDESIEQHFAFLKIVAADAVRRRLGRHFLADASTAGAAPA